ncbi:MAG TPA: hypothetical protein PKC43_11165 [Phycisphaerales bacterium]|nr:hypothetical protein [Phycisphaerales bacterium]HMP37993.1 hypothetical protein [Phycisphaerales bacterium]
MPVYEYICEEDGERIELIRPMRDADAPVEDPSGRGRSFVRALTTPMVAAARSGGAAAPTGGGCCPCGKPGGMCGG